MTADAQEQDRNAEIWKSKERLQDWLSKMDARERKRADQVRFMAQLLPFADEEAFTFLDLGAGTGAAARGLLAFYPNAQAILADFSPAMMDEGAQIMASYDGRYRYVEFDMLSSDWPSEIPSRLDAIITSQCIHHLPDERKRSLFREILEHLKPGSWYVNFDPVSASDPAVEAAWKRVNDRLDPSAAHAREHRSPAELERHANHTRYMIDLDSQLEFLREAGFAAVDTYWKQLDYVIYGGYRPE